MMYIFWVYYIVTVEALFEPMLNGVRPESNAYICNAERLCNFGNVNA